MNESNILASSKHFWHGTFQHALLLAALIPGAFFMALPELDGTTWLGVEDVTWFWIALGTPIVHQLLVWLVFRAQICFNLLSRLFGKADLKVWGSVFFPLLISRPLTLLALGLADRGSLGKNQFYYTTLGLILLIPTFYALYSVKKYFVPERALGGDHFRAKYRAMPKVTQGIFRYSANSMYTYVFMGLWSIALLTGSKAALGIALFQHAYIWVHMFCTEEPDMQQIYGSQNR